MEPLSKRQQQIYDYIVSYTQDNGYPPSVREIGATMSLKSPSTAHFHLKVLEERGYISRTQGKTRAISIVPREEEQVEAPENQVPLLGHVAAGSPILATQQVEDYLPYDTGGRTGEHFALRVRGDSMMEAGILDGDAVIVHQRCNFRNGEIVVALLEDEATVKTLRRKDGQTWLLPENPEYQPIDGTNAQLLGKVVAVLRQYE